MKTLNRMRNYALITESIDNLFVDLYKSKDKKTIKRLVNEIKNNKDLQILYTIVDNLKNGEVSKEYVDDFINENVKAAKAKDFSSFNKMVDDVVIESNELLDSIGTILFEEKTVFNLAQYTKAYNQVKTHLIEKNTWREELSSTLNECSVEYTELEETDKKLFESFIKSNSEGKTKLYNTTKEECIELLNKHIQETTDLSTKVKLYETKDMVMQLNEGETLVPDMVKLHNLKKGLLNE